IPEETDYSGITSVKKKISFLSLLQSQDREEEIDKKRPTGYLVKEDLEKKVSSWNSGSPHAKP
ncbi:hypothetical protein T08_1008, partial [Trichinella sp. T8]